MPPAQAAGARESLPSVAAPSSAPVNHAQRLPAAVAAVRHLKSSTAERVLLHTRSAQFKRLLVRAGFPLLPSASHIVPVWVGDAAKAKAASDALLRRFGLYVQVRAAGACGARNGDEGRKDCIPMLVGPTLACPSPSQPINYPTVPRGQERLRMTPSPFHSAAMLSHMVDSLGQVWRELGLPLAPQPEAAAEATPAYEYAGPALPSTRLDTPASEATASQLLGRQHNYAAAFSAATASAAAAAAGPVGAGAGAGAALA